MEALIAYRATTDQRHAEALRCLEARCGSAADPAFSTAKAGQQQPATASVGIPTAAAAVTLAMGGAYAVRRRRLAGLAPNDANGANDAHLAAGGDVKHAALV